MLVAIGECAQSVMMAANKHHAKWTLLAKEAVQQFMHVDRLTIIDVRGNKPTQCKHFGINLLTFAHNPQTRGGVEAGT